jgi:phosphoribosylformimino-5-aminoimidazole carboxamide ribotide isomerase
MPPEQTPPRLIPVIDVMNGEVVRAVAGNREQYRPIVSRLVASSEPVVVATALLACSGARELYIADLDAIRGRPTLAPEIVRVAEVCQVPCWLDIGINDKRDVHLLAGNEWFRPVIPLETGATPRHFRSVLAVVGSRHVAVSIDLRAGEILGNWRAWGASHARDTLTVARTACAAGAHAVIVLDIAQVGTGRGTGTEDYIRVIRAEFPALDIIAGGGIRTRADLQSLADAGATAVLVASALHDGTLGVTQ